MKSINLITVVGSILIISLIVFLSFYLNSRKKLSEMFIDKADTAYEDTISSLTRTYLFRAPTPSEIKAYIKVMGNPNDVSRVIREIKKGEEYKKLQNASTKSNSYPFHSDSQPLAPNIPLQKEYDITDKRVDDLPVPEKTAYYRRIIAIYDRILFRMPTMEELNYYTARMLSDTTFDDKKLQILLESSREFEILQKNQNNQVFSELSGSTTDAQIEYEVEEIYKQAIGGREKGEEGEEKKRYRGLGDSDMADYEKGDQMMSTSMFEFLKHKYKEYELNEKRLFDLIVLIHDLDKKNVHMDLIVKGGKGGKGGEEKKKKEGKTSKSEQSENTGGFIDDIEDIENYVEKELKNLEAEIKGFGGGGKKKEKEKKESFTDSPDTDLSSTSLSYIDAFQKRAEDILNRGRAQAIQKNQDLKRSAERFNKLSEYISNAIREKGEEIIKRQAEIQNRVRETDPNLPDFDIDPVRDDENIIDSVDAKNRAVQEKFHRQSCSNGKEKEKENKEIKKKKKMNKNKKGRTMSSCPVLPTCGLRNPLYRTFDYDGGGDGERGGDGNIQEEGGEEKRRDIRDKKEDLPYSYSYERARYPSDMYSYEPYNICNVNPFSTIHNKTRDVYDKKRNGLAYAQNKRNLNELKDRCHRQTRFLNASDDMVLFPEYKWSVPQPRAPVCEMRSEQKYDQKYEPLMAQTALIGTLLDER